MEHPLNNLSAVLYGANDLRLENVPVPEPEKEEVQLKVLNCGLCGTDHQIVEEYKCGTLEFPHPFILGHETCGVITKLGDGVNRLKVGDRVSLEGGLPCFTCIKCKSGKYNLCKSLMFKGIGRNGGLTRYTTNREEFCYKIPDNISDEEGALVEPLSVAVKACKKADVQIGETVLVCGAGPIGLLTFQCARAMGAGIVLVTDISSERLQLAKKLGADYTVNVRGKSPVEAAKLIEDTLGGLADVTLECSGATPGISTAIYATTSGGNVTLVGIGDMVMEVPLGVAALYEVDVRGSVGFVEGAYPAALSLLENKLVDVESLSTHRFNLEEIHKAYKVAGSGEAIKVTVRCAQ